LGGRKLTQPLLVGFRPTLVSTPQHAAPIQTGSRPLQTPSRQFMSILGYAALTGGTNTVIGTSTNLVISGAREHQQGPSRGGALSPAVWGGQDNCSNMLKSGGRTRHVPASAHGHAPGPARPPYFDPSFGAIRRAPTDRHDERPVRQPRFPLLPPRLQKDHTF
jgi:hypothetical protein